MSRNFALLSASQAVGRLLAFGVTVYLTRALGVQSYGLVAFALGVLAYGSLLVDLGLDGLGQREVARGRTPLERLVPTVVALRLALLGVAAPLFAGFVLLVPLDRVGRSVVLLYGLSLLADALDLRWVFLGSERPAWVGTGEALTQVTLLAGVVAAVRTPEDVLWVPLAFLAGRLAAVALLAFGYRWRIGRIRWAPDRSLFRPLVRQALPVGGSAAVGMLSHNFDLVLLGLWLGSGATGLYGAAYRVVWVPTTFAMAYYAVIRPSIARGYLEGIESVRGLLDRSFRWTTAAGVGLVAWAGPLAQPILVRLYGTDYSAAAPALRLLLVGSALVIVNRHYRALLVSFDHQGAALRVMAAGGLANVVLNLALIPRWGIAGAAAATALSEALVLVLGALATRASIARMPFGRHLLRPAVAALPTLAVLLVPAEVPVVARAVAAAALYPALLLLLRVVTVEEVVAVAGGWIPARSRGRAGRE